MFRKVLLVGIACLAAALYAAPETHADEVVATIMSNVVKLKAARPDAVPMLSWLSPLIGIAFFYVSYKIWMYGAMKYSGTGS